MQLHKMFVASLIISFIAKAQSTDELSTQSSSEPATSSLSTTPITINPYAPGAGAVSTQSLSSVVGSGGTGASGSSGGTGAGGSSGGTGAGGSSGGTGGSSSSLTSSIMSSSWHPVDTSSSSSSSSASSSSSSSSAGKDKPVNISPTVESPKPTGLAACFVGSLAVGAITASLKSLALPNLPPLPDLVSVTFDIPDVNVRVKFPDMPSIDIPKVPEITLPSFKPPTLTFPSLSPPAMPTMPILPKLPELPKLPSMFSIPKIDLCNSLPGVPTPSVDFAPPSTALDAVKNASDAGCPSPQMPAISGTMAVRSATISMCGG